MITINYNQKRTDVPERMIDVASLLPSIKNVKIFIKMVDEILNFINKANHFYVNDFFFSLEMQSNGLIQQRLESFF